VKPRGDLHLPLAVGVVAVGVEVGAVVLYTIESIWCGGSTAAYGVRTMRDAGDVLVVEQVECLGKDLQAVAAEAAIG
jgi:hypothetical protein